MTTTSTAHDKTQQNIYDAAFQINIPNERIEGVRYIDNLMFFRVGSQHYAARIGKNGHVRKNSTSRV